MRQLKFRAWHKEQKRMFNVYGLGVDFITENTLDGINPGVNAFCDDDLNFIEVMQFTGLTDSNGKDIYEGDRMESEIYGTGFVQWNNDHSTFTVFIPDNADDDQYYFVKGFGKVVGNLYQD